MTPNSKIYLKGVREPIIVAEDKARKLEVAFLDTSVSLNTPFSVDGKSFLKEMIKGIDIAKNTSDLEEKGIRTPHWIIFSPSKKSMWQRPYLSFEDAARELEYQKINLSEDEIKNLDWVILKQ